jgi:hypothetical protein
MELDSGTTTLIPLPEFPQRYGSGFSTRRTVGFRRFGIVEDDLRADFATPNRAALATRLLNACAVDPDRALPENFFRELSLGKRIECLLVLALGGADDTLRFPFKCVGCAEELEFEVTLAEIAALQSEADAVEIVGVQLGGQRIELQKFSGGDQETLSTVVFHDELEAAMEMISTLLVDPDAIEPLGSSDVEAIEEAMEVADPLVNFNCRVTCGECGRPNDDDIDLLETALGMLGRAQRRLILSIHRLALHYHWSEREILAVPAWRREQYLELIGAKV